LSHLDARDPGIAEFVNRRYYRWLYHPHDVRIRWFFETQDLHHSSMHAQDQAISFLSTLSSSAQFWSHQQSDAIAARFCKA
jgi:hypothetical protein